MVDSVDGVGTLLEDLKKNTMLLRSEKCLI